MVADKKLAHIVLQTGQRAALRDWYLEVLDAHVVFENEFLCFMTFDDEHHRLAIAQLPNPVQRTAATVGMAHSAYTYADLASLLNKCEALKKSGLHPYAPVQHGVTTSIYYRDPDCNMVELQIDNFATPEESTAYMRGDEYSRDPFGPSFDPDFMLAALRAGSLPSELTTRSWARTCPQLDVAGLLLP